MGQGFQIYSQNLEYLAIFQADNNFCIYTTAGHNFVWNSGSYYPNAPMKLQIDSTGNVCVMNYAKSGPPVAVWCTNTNYPLGVALGVSDTGQLIVTAADQSVVLWSS